MPTLVPNQKPSIDPGQRRLAVIGEAPGTEEEREGVPFVGASGRMLRAILHSLGVNPAGCLLGNVCQVRPPQNQITNFRLDSPELQHGIAQLANDLNEFRPNCVLVLGQTALKVFGEHRSLGNLRGSLFISPTFGYKTLGSYHPAACLRNYSWTFYLRYDIFRAKTQAMSASLDLPQREIRVAPQLGDVMNYLMQILQSKPRIAIDLEGYPEERGITCLSVFDSPFSGMTIPFYRLDGNAYWSLDEEVIVWDLLNKVLSDPEIEKIAQNALYELFVFAWSHQLIIRNVHDDTMLKHWEMFNEMEKSLGVQASIYTLEPYWKDERTVADSNTHWLYCGKDSAVTYEINNVLDVQLAKQPRQLQHYRFNISMLRPYLYLELRGCRVDTSRLAEHQRRLAGAIFRQQQKVNDLTGMNFNVKSPKQKQEYFYDKLGLPVQFKPRTNQITVDEDAILNLATTYDEPSIVEILQLIHLRTEFSDSYKVLPFHDGRMRCSYNLVGTETGRLSSSETAVSGTERMPKWVFKKDGTFELQYKLSKFRYGTNLQNQAKWIRDIFVPDPGHVFFQLDLAGADAWTVALDLNALGHSVMLEDLQAGIKPSKMILLMMKHGLHVNSWDRTTLREKLKEVESDGPMYLCAKRVQHGTNYGMAAKRIVLLVRKDSARQDLDNIVSLPVRIAEQMQQLYKARYRPELRVNYVTQQLQKTGAIECASGVRRKFTSLRSRTNIDQQSIRDALAQEPQANTTYATNLALHNLYYCDYNRNPDGSLFVDPQIMVHDALGGQFSEDSIDRACVVLKQSFNNSLLINNQSIVIPADGGYGTSWKNLDHEI
jgi:uracil-DNA glycosylase